MLIYSNGNNCNYLLDEQDKSAMVVESSQQESPCLDNQKDSTVEERSENEACLSKKEDMEDDLEYKEKGE